MKNRGQDKWRTHRFRHKGRGSSENQMAVLWYCLSLTMPKTWTWSLRQRRRVHRVHRVQGPHHCGLGMLQIHMFCVQINRCMQTYRAIHAVCTWIHNCAHKDHNIHIRTVYRLNHRQLGQCSIFLATLHQMDTWKMYVWNIICFFLKLQGIASRYLPYYGKNSPSFRHWPFYFCWDNDSGS